MLSLSAVTRSSTRVAEAARPGRHLGSDYRISLGAELELSAPNERGGYMPPTHKTGEYVPRNEGGQWKCSNGHVTRVQGGDVFPPCKDCGKEQTWTYVGP